jgi:hypothetical protein
LTLISIFLLKDNICSTYAFLSLSIVLRLESDHEGSLLKIGNTLLGKQSGRNDVIISAVNSSLWWI